MPDSIRHPEVPRILFLGFQLYGRNDKSLGDNIKLASPEGPALYYLFQTARGKGTAWRTGRGQKENGKQETE